MLEADFFGYLAVFFKAVITFTLIRYYVAVIKFTLIFSCQVKKLVAKYRNVYLSFDIKENHTQSKEVVGFNFYNC